MGLEIIPEPIRKINKLCFRVLPFCFTLLAVAQTNVPRFEDYPVSEEWHGPAAPLQLHRRERWFKTRLSEAAKEPPDFAGHYRFAGWGCGTLCAAGAIIDLETGIVYPPPRGGHGSDPHNINEFWIFSLSLGPIGLPYAEHRVDSRLMIVRRGSPDFPTLADTYYLVWEGNRFRQIMFVPGKKDGDGKSSQK